jgi:hypothetical protein
MVQTQPLGSARYALAEHALTEHALLASGCDMGDNAGGNFVRYATATL